MSSRTFLALFLGAATEAEKAEVSDADSDAFLQRWMAWAGAHEEAIVDAGAPLGRASRVTADGSVEAPNTIVTYTLARAPSLEAALEMFREHPHVALAPGNAIEVMELQTMPEA